MEDMLNKTWSLAMKVKWVSFKEQMVEKTTVNASQLRHFNTNKLNKHCGTC